MEHAGAPGAFRDGWDFSRLADGAVVADTLAAYGKKGSESLPRYAWLSEPHAAPFVLPMSVAAPACVAILELWAIVMLAFWPVFVGASLVALFSCGALVDAAHAGRGRRDGTARLWLPQENDGLGVRYEDAIRQAIVAAGLHLGAERTTASPRFGTRRTVLRLRIPVQIVYAAVPDCGPRMISVCTTGRDYVGHHQRLKGAILESIVDVDGLSPAREINPSTDLGAVSSADPRAVLPPKPNAVA